MAKKKASSSSSRKKTTKKAASPAGAAASKKKTTKKATTRKSSRATASTASKKTAAKKSTTKKATSKKTSSKTTTSKTTTTKAATTKTPSTKSGASKKVSKKPSTKAAPGASRKASGSKTTTAKKTTTKKTTAKKPTATQAASKKPAETKAASSKSAASSGAAAKPGSSKSAQAGAGSDDKKAGRKGITIVENRPKRKSTAKPKITPPEGTLGALLAKRRRQPLIPSGPDAPPSPHSAFGDDDSSGTSRRKLKSPFKKKQLDSFREKLLEKRRELAGDVANMESGMASRGDRGGNPALDVAEQGSDAYDQSLSIGFAEADRKIIREIDEALKRIDEGTYGLCEMTRQPIGLERLNQLPWARLSIEAAREIERRGGAR